ncbi:MAG: hypothetical protein EOP49_15435, partial [Sphingobacteriales bacterium]
MYQALVKRVFRSIAVLLLLLPAVSLPAQVNVTSSYSAQALASRLAGEGITVLNPVLNCPSKANGLFTSSTGSPGIDSGIVLSTGYVASVTGVNGVDGLSGSLASYNFGAAGDPALNSLSGQSTHDACALEFDFVPRGESVNFQYVFSSEEYINATCGPYNDAFAFFISGPGITGQKNMALVPGTNIPVTINSINSGNPGPGYTLANCYAMGPGAPFTSYFIDNSNGPYITHKGMTQVLD